MKFSVIIPIYNKEQYIERALSSVESQTFQDFEVILIDDGCTDQSVQVVKHFLSAHPNFSRKVKFIHQANQGSAAARNAGIHEAKCQWISFLDADDRWYPDYLETIWRLIRLYPQAGFYVTAYRICLPENRKVLSTRLKPMRGCLDSYWNTFSFGRYDFVWTSVTTLHREDVLNVGGFKKGEMIGQDLDLWARIARINPKVAYSSRICADYQRDTVENARTRVKVAHAKAFMKDLQEEMRQVHTEDEIASMSHKYDLKMTVYLFTLLMNGEKGKARREMSLWTTRNIKGWLLQVGLWAASFSPVWLCQWVYQWRLRYY